MVGFELLLGHSATPPGYFREVGGGDDEGVEGQVGDGELGFEFFDGLVEFDFGIGGAVDVAQAFGVDEVDVLLVTIQEPEDKVGVEVAGFEETDSAATAEIAEQVQLFAFEEALVAVTKGLQIKDEVAFAGVLQHDGADLDQIVADVDERLVQVAAECDDIHPLKLDRFQFPRLDGDFDLLQLADDLVARLSN